MIAQAFLVRAGALLLALGAVACSTTVGADGPSEANPLDDEESALVYQLNQVREMAGIATPLVVCNTLDVSAAAHSDDMRDNDYLSDDAPDGATLRTRACSAGYTPGCNANEAMAEFVAKGIDGGKDTVTKWMSNAMTNATLVEPQLTVVGAGRSITRDGITYWTLDLADKDDSSCH